MQPTGQKIWYQESLTETVRLLRTDLASGISAHEVATRIKQHGRNELSESKRRSFIDRTVDELKSPLAFILLSAGIVTTLLGQYVDSTIIFIALIVNIAISLYQEGRADRSFERLRASQERFAVVIRDGKKREVHAQELVQGDVIVLETGMHIPADARVILANNLEVNESPLTGEWIDVAKNEAKLDTILPPTEQKNMVFMGTLVTAGSGKAVVVATGDATEIGAIAKALKGSEEGKTPLQENIANVARMLSFVVLFALIGIFLLGLFRGEPLTELLLISIAIAVAAIPEGLPAAVTVVLAIGMEAVLKRGGLVRNLLAAETLGSTTIILTDKTGTLTKAEMRVARVVTLGTLEMEKRQGNEHKLHEVHGDERDALQFAALASDAFIERKEGEKEGEPLIHGRPVERAVVLAALASGLDQSELLVNYPRIDFLPFESAHRVGMSLNDIRGLKHNRLYITGAPEYLLSQAGAFYLEGKVHDASRELTELFERVLSRHTKEGMRLIGVAYRDTTMERFLPAHNNAREDLIKGLIFVGFIVLNDPLREDVKESIATAQKAGARVIMATGDNAETARTIAEECGIWKAGDHVVSGIDTEKRSDEELTKLLKHVSVFARTLPEHKLRIARLLAAEGEVVAMTGDGVNDAPALRAASIGVALGSGTEVAKEASDLILLNNSFSIIVAAIEEGRRIIDNLRKIVAYLLSTSFTEVIVVAGALIAGMPLPLLPAQILWTNMLSEGFMNFAFAFEPKEDDVMKRDPKLSGARNMMSKTFISFIAFVGITSGLTLLFLYVLLVQYWHLPLEEARTVLFAALTLGTISVSFSMKDLRSSIFTIRFHSNRYLLGACAFALLGLFSAFNIPLISRLLKLGDISLLSYAFVLLAVVMINIAFVEIAKFVLFERRGRA